MKLTELRIGNWVLVPTNREIIIPNCPKQIKGIPSDGRVLIEMRPQDERGDWYESKNHIKDIEITEEWLKGLGFTFEKCGASGSDMWQGMDIWKKEDVTFRGHKDGIVVHLRLAGFFNNLIIHVHQLQNLYHALTGKELGE